MLKADTCSDIEHLVQTSVQKELAKKAIRVIAMRTGHQCFAASFASQVCATVLTPWSGDRCKNIKVSINSHHLDVRGMIH